MVGFQPRGAAVLEAGLLAAGLLSAAFLGPGASQRWFNPPGCRHDTEKVGARLTRRPQTHGESECRYRYTLLMNNTLKRFSNPKGRGFYKSRVYRYMA